MISVSVPSKQIVIDYFKTDIEGLKKYFSAIAFDYNDAFNYFIFKEFIYAAAGMFKDIDISIYNKDLVTKFQSIQFLDNAYSDFKKRSQFASHAYEQAFLQSQESYMEVRSKFETLRAELQLIITKEQNLHQQFTKLKSDFEKKYKNSKSSEAKEAEMHLKYVRKEHVDALHILGIQRNELDRLQSTMQAFEKEHKEEFFEYFNAIKEKLDYQYRQSMNYFGFLFNQSLFANSQKSEEIQKFKREADIHGEITICKYLEYYVKNINPDALKDAKRKEQLKEAQEYCASRKKM